MIMNNMQKIEFFVNETKIDMFETRLNTIFFSISTKLTKIINFETFCQARVILNVMRHMFEIESNSTMKLIVSKTIFLIAFSFVENIFFCFRQLNFSCVFFDI